MARWAVWPGVWPCLMALLLLLTVTCLHSWGEKAEGGAEPSLAFLLNQSGSDKVWQHGYQRYYEPVLGPLRHFPVRFLEIGVEDGRSLAAWRQYFTRPAQLVGVGWGNWQTDPVTSCSCPAPAPLSCALPPGQDLAAAPCTLYRGDQSDPAFLARLVANTGGNFTVVVDDGSHLPSHQLLTLETLWPSLAPGGLYIGSIHEIARTRRHNCSKTVVT